MNPIIGSSKCEEKVDPTESLESKVTSDITKLKKKAAEHFIDQDHSDSNMVVAIRVRPISSKELSNGDFDTIAIEDKLLVFKTIIS